MMRSLLITPIGKVGKSVWQHLPPQLEECSTVRTLGHWIHALTRAVGNRNQSESTWFLRNLPLLHAIRDAVADFKSGCLQLCVLGCSTGAEIYSLLWVLRNERPGLRILPIGLDISASALQKARSGRYSRLDPELRKELPSASLTELFDVAHDELQIKDWIAAGIDWRLGDARDANLRSDLGLQDLVLANNFLVHLRPRESSACLRNVIQLVKPGVFVCRGVELDVRERAVQEFGLQPIPTHVEEIHNADGAMDARYGWPWHYWGLEPLNKSRKDWIRRYAVLFRVPSAPKSSTTPSRERR